MRDIHVIYADSNSADFAGFKNRYSRRNECRYLVSQASRIFPSERTAHARVKYASPAYFTRACAVRSLGKIRLACETSRYPDFESVFGQCSGPSPAPSSYTSSKKGTVRRDWNDIDNRNGRDVLEKRQRRETEGTVFETRGTGKEDGLDVLRDVLLQLERVCTCITYIYANSLTLAPKCPAFH